MTPHLKAFPGRFPLARHLRHLTAAVRHSELVRALVVGSVLWLATIAVLIGLLVL